MINIILILFLPFLTCILIIILGKIFGKNGVVLISLLNIFLIFIISIINIYLYFKQQNFIFTEFSNWIYVGLFSISWVFNFDILTLMLFFVITSISFVVQLFSYEYMKGDPFIIKFFLYLSLFTFFMLILISSNNLIQLFLGWEGVGICSYLLISFWNTRLAAGKSAIKALIVNKIGDIFLIFSISIIFFTFKTLSFNNLFILIPFFLKHIIYVFNIKFYLINFIAFFLLIGGLTKSAQIGLHTWLPDAMEGPTPVSALIHAATMVTAGIFLIIRFSPFFEFIPNILFLMVFLGSLTTFFGSSIGLLQNDIKKIIAYSTCSQLGYMVLACGLSNYSSSLFHLINHAFFKALLFLSAGALIHLLNNEQDIRKMGTLVKITPFIYLCFLLGTFSLIGFPFFSGFYSKDSIIENIYIYSYTGEFFIFFWLIILSSSLTTFYSFRLIFFVFFNINNSYKRIIILKKNLTNITFFSLFLLMLGSIFSGFLLKDIFINMGTDFFNNFIFILPWKVKILEIEILPFFIKFLPIIISIIFSYFTLILYTYFYNLLVFIKIKYNFFFFFFFNKWYFNNIYNKIIVENVINISFFLFLALDQGILEFSNVTKNYLYKMNIYQTKYLINNWNMYYFVIILNICLFSLIINFY